MTHITDLPNELVVCIGNYLPKHDILAIILTCHKLHTALIHLLWKDITLQKGKLPSPVSRLVDNASNVQRLHNFGIIPPEYYHINFPGLVVLEIHFKGSNPKRLFQGSVQQEINNMELIRYNPTIQILTIHLANYNPSNDFWEAIARTLTHPRSLHLTGVFDLLGRTPVNAFWGAFARFEEVSCAGRDGILLDLVPPMAFPGLTRFSLAINTGYSDINNTIVHLEWLKRCPNLTSLRWDLAESPIPVIQFAEALEHSTTTTTIWQHLKELSLIGITETDEDLAIIIRQLPPLTRFEIEAKQFGPQCFAWLRICIFQNIQTLHLWECTRVSGQMVLDILQNCVHLKDLEASYVGLSDLLANPHPWVCRELKRLRLYFDNDMEPVGEVDNFSPTVFQALSRLVHLEDIDVDEDPMWEYSVATMAPVKKLGPPIQWRLDSGLSQLSTLQQLRTLRCEKTFQSARLEDVQWMLQNWPRLRELTGPLTHDLDARKILIDLLEKRQIKNNVIHFKLRLYSSSEDEVES
ncbi:hypothetical protein FBU30_006202 [Linnemannia zychae]|nr:hypothetical protein FBU30_006202 [Linnemannia zychae]